MDTTVIEIADGIFRLSTYLDPTGMALNEFLLVEEEPLVFYLGHRRLFLRAHIAVEDDPRLASPSFGSTLDLP